MFEPFQNETSGYAPYLNSPDASNSGEGTGENMGKCGSDVKDYTENYTESFSDMSMNDPVPMNVGENEGFVPPGGGRGGRGGSRGGSSGGSRGAPRGRGGGSSRGIGRGGRGGGFSPRGRGGFSPRGRGGFSPRGHGHGHWGHGYRGNWRGRGLGGRWLYHNKWYSYNPYGDLIVVDDLLDDYPEIIEMPIVFPTAAPQQPPQTAVPETNSSVIPKIDNNFVIVGLLILIVLGVGYYSMKKK